MHATAEAITTPAAIAAAVLHELEQAWNRADGTGFGAAFAEDADFVDIRGDHHQGRAAIGHGHQAIFDSIYAGSTVRYELDAAREVVPGCIVAVGSATLDAPGGPLQGIHRSRSTLTIIEHGDRWAVAAFQNTLVQASG
jgi:uncharacterized protein (TIGR02246 family)